MHVKYKYVSISIECWELLFRHANELGMTMDKFIKFIKGKQPQDNILKTLLRYRGKLVTERLLRKTCGSHGSPRAKLNHLSELDLGIEKVKGMYYRMRPASKTRRAIFMKTMTWRYLSLTKYDYGFKNLEDTILYLFIKNYDKVLNAEERRRREREKTYSDSGSDESEE